VKNDEKWDCKLASPYFNPFCRLGVKTQKLLSKNEKLDTFIREMKNKKSKEEQKEGLVDRAGVKDKEIDEMDKYVTDEDFDGTVGEQFFLNDYDENTLIEVMDEQDKLIDLLKKFGKTKHLAHRLLIVFDDLVGSSLFSGRKDNPFKKLNTNHRHYSASLFMVTQGNIYFTTRKSMNRSA